MIAVRQKRDLNSALSCSCVHPRRNEQRPLDTEAAETAVGLPSTPRHHRCLDRFKVGRAITTPTNVLPPLRGGTPRSNPHAAPDAASVSAHPARVLFTRRRSLVHSQPTPICASSDGCGCTCICRRDHSPSRTRKCHDNC